MAPTEPIVASAVVVPELPEPTAPPTPEVPTASTKRRQSSVSEADSKRPRLSVDGNNGADAEAPQSPNRDRHVERRKTAQAEERKRGQRLFGGLLGTLSQSSSSKAQKRREEIEKKQQEKLKVQQSELDENKKRRRDRVMQTRRREQQKFDEQSMRIRHSNTLAMAHFLQTKTQPTLYYKPWELRPEEVTQIDSQIKDAEDAIEAELEQFEESRVAKHQSGSAADAPEKADEEIQNDKATTVRQEASEHPESSERQIGGTNGSSLQLDGAVDDEPASLAEPAIPENLDDYARKQTTEADKNGLEIDPSIDTGDNSHENHDDNGETVLEAEEDTVIY